MNQTPWVEGTHSNDQTLDGMAWDGDVPGTPSRTTDWYLDSERPEFTQPDVDTTTDYGFGPNGVLDRVTVDAVPAKWVEFKVTGAVRDWISGKQNHGLMLKHTTEGSPYTDGQKRFLTSDYTQDPTLRPKLVITYR